MRREPMSKRQITHYVERSATGAVDNRHGATILCPCGFIMTKSGRAFLTIRNGFDARRVDAESNQVILGSVCAALAKTQRRGNHATQRNQTSALRLEGCANSHDESHTKTACFCAALTREQTKHT